MGPGDDAPTGTNLSARGPGAEAGAGTGPSALTDVSPDAGFSPEEDSFVSLYRRFRPGRFADLRGQDHVVRALQGAAREGRPAHAYLFSGPRGTGKTSTARILAKALNCENPRDGEPCGRCASCIDIARGSSLDVHELDAASNNGVDAMRDLIARAGLATPGRWKLYIVDEVHMLSTAAANSLLKTLEEPPPHVIFVLATTDPQKVPPTIRSRTQHFEFRLLGADVLTELLRDVRDRAGLHLDDQALAVAVRRARGSARDALSTLDQAAASGSAEGARPDLAEVVEALCDEDAGRVLVGVAVLLEAGWGAQQLSVELVDELRQAFLVSLAPDVAEVAGPDQQRLGRQAERLGLPRLVRAIETLGQAQVEMRDTADPRVVLEVALVRLARVDIDDSAAALAERLSRVERALAARPDSPRSTPRSGGTGGGRSGGGAEEDSDDVGNPSAPGDDPEKGRLPGERPALGALRRGGSSRSGSDDQEAHAPRRAPENRDASDERASDNRAPDNRASDNRAPDDRAPDNRTPDNRTLGGGAPVGASGGVGAGAAMSEVPSNVPPRDTLVEVWGDHVLRSLPARAKALFAAGRFLEVSEGAASFALPNEAHRQRCEELRTSVESALADRVGIPVPLRLVVDEFPGTPAGSMEVEGVVEAFDTDIQAFATDEGADAPFAGPDQGIEAAAQARLLEAFPGAEEVEG